MKIGDYCEFQAPGPRSKLNRGWIAAILENDIIRVRVKSGHYCHAPRDYVRVIPERVVRTAYIDD